MLKKLLTTIGGIALSGFLTGVFIVIIGITPAEWFAYIFSNPPAYLENIWFKIGLIVFGLLVIGISLHSDVWFNYIRKKHMDDKKSNKTTIFEVSNGATLTIFKGKIRGDANLLNAYDKNTKVTLHDLDYNKDTDK